MPFDLMNKTSVDAVRGRLACSAFPRPSIADAALHRQSGSPLRRKPRLSRHDIARDRPFRKSVRRAGPQRRAFPA
jgi:hypothetical protein